MGHDDGEPTSLTFGTSGIIFCLLLCIRVYDENNVPPDTLALAFVNECDFKK